MIVTFCVASSDNVSGSAAVGNGESKVIVCDPAGSWNWIVCGDAGRIVRIQQCLP